MIKTLADRVQRIKPSPTLAVSARAEELQKSGKNIINLSVGEPDFDTPQHIKDAAIQAIQNGQTKYTAVDGTQGLKQAICNKFKHENHLNYQLNQILVSCGAKHSLFNIFATMINPGDEVIIPAPYWVSYPDMVLLTDGKPIFITTDHTQQFKITPAQLEAAITPRTRLVILNSPSNPTGMAYTKAELCALGAVLLKYPDVLVVSDDIYEHILWNHTPFTNIVMACPALYNQVIVVNGVSKAYAMTGWRIGYAAGPAHIIAAMKKVQSQVTSNPTSIAQAAAQAGLSGDTTTIQSMCQSFKERHDFVYAALSTMPGVSCLAGDGAFYCFPDFSALLGRKTLANDIDLAEYLLDKAGVAVIPGSAFGAPGYLRISYATSIEKLQQAMDNMRAALDDSRNQY
ncbi:MAG: aspartate aminotransferase [Gammaproteobacteria bacterium RIFCSPHIGHO2_12_FULL_41_20]|nr:MAG: aspartate aminotransferase [Gammaproteobacteria bacterium RIFCSPHIGHO2_12_FULL_41_20]